MEYSSKNMDTLMNVRGTTCKSFVIGKKDISFASNAILSSSVEDLTKYKTLVVKNENKKKVIYDMEISAKAVKYITEEGGLTRFHLMDGTSILIKGSTAGVESDVTSDTPTSVGEIVTFADTSGKVITKSGFSIMRAEDLPGHDIVVETTTDLENLIAAYKQDLTLDKKLPTMKAVMDYVGTIDSVLELRRNGELPAGY